MGTRRDGFPAVLYTALMVCPIVLWSRAMPSWSSEMNPSRPQPLRHKSRSFILSRRRWGCTSSHQHTSTAHPIRAHLTSTSHQRAPSEPTSSTSHQHTSPAHLTSTPHQHTPSEHTSPAYLTSTPHHSTPCQHTSPAHLTSTPHHTTPH